MISKLYYKAP